MASGEASRKLGNFLKKKVATHFPDVHENVSIPSFVEVFVGGRAFGGPGAEGCGEL